MNLLSNFSRAFVAARNAILGQKRTILSVPNDASNFSRKVFMEEIAKKIDHEAWERFEDVNDFIEETKEEIADGKWSKGKICDVAGNTVFEGPISEKLKNSLLKKSFLFDGKKGKSDSALDIKFDKATDKKSDLVFINVSKNPIPSKQDDVLTFEFDEISKADSKNIKRIAVQKFLNQSESGISKPDQLIRNLIMMTSELQFDLNLKEKKFSIPNLEEIKEKYVEKNAKSGDEKAIEDASRSFYREVSGAVRGIFSELSYAGAGGHSDRNIYDIGKEGNFSEKDPAIAECLKRSEPKIYQSAVPKNNSLSGEDKSTHLVNSPLRNEDSLIYGGFITNRSSYERNFAKSFLTNAVLESAAQQSFGENFDQFFKQLNYAPIEGSVAFPRDYSIYFDRAFHQTDQRVAKAISDEKYPHHKQKSSSSDLDRLDSHRADLRTAGYDIVRDIPFDAKGGNMIFTKNSNGEKVLIATVSDAYFSDEGEFLGGYILDEKGNLKESSNSPFWKLMTGDKYPKFRQQIIDWGKNNAGCDHVVVLDRNIFSPDRNQFKGLYHLDVFCGALPGGNVLINPESITQSGMNELKQVFGENKITEISHEEKKELCANFVTMGKMVVMSSPKTPKSFIDKVNNLGFDVYVPPIYLSKDETLRDGWPAGIRCLTSSTDGSEKTAEITDSKTQISDEKKSPTKAIKNSGHSRLVGQAETLTR